MVSIHFVMGFKQIDFMVAATSRFVSTMNSMFLFQHEIRTVDKEKRPKNSPSKSIVYYIKAKIRNKILSQNCSSYQKKFHSLPREKKHDEVKKQLLLESTHSQ